MSNTDAVIADLNRRMLGTLLMPPFQLGPKPRMCPACGRTRVACLAFYGRDWVHDAEIREALHGVDRLAIAGTAALRLESVAKP